MFKNKTRTINKGAVIYVGFEKHDDKDTVKKAIRFLLNRRIFPDKNSKINISAKEYKAEFLIIPNFTLSARFRKGQQRISFENTLNKDDARSLFTIFVKTLKEKHPFKVVSGGFGENMIIEQHLKGPYTYTLNI